MVIIKNMTDTPNNNNTNNSKYILHLDCEHRHVVNASFLTKPVKRDLQGSSYYLCNLCMRRDPGSCSIDPVHKALDIWQMPPPPSSK
jgi:hypothetical protein